MKLLRRAVGAVIAAGGFTLLVAAPTGPPVPWA
jgi:hypothetical protein